MKFFTIKSLLFRVAFLSMLFAPFFAKGGIQEYRDAALVGGTFTLTLFGTVASVLMIQKMIHNKEKARADIALAQEKAKEEERAKEEKIVLSGEERKLIAYHEAGHALLSILVPNDHCRLKEVTIIPTKDSLGLTSFTSVPGRHVENKAEYEGEMAIACGGRAAEELFCNILTSDASSDFACATEIAYKMVCKYGMDPEIGVVVIPNHAACSDQTKLKIETAIKSLVDKAMLTAKQLLTDNRDKLDKIASALLEKETLTAAQVYELLVM